VAKVKKDKENLESGYRLFYRSLIGHSYVGFEKPFKRSEAWQWLIFSAWGDEKKQGEVFVNNRLFKVSYGELVYSVRFLAEAWGWGDKMVRTFLTNLEKLDMISKGLAQAASGDSALNSVIEGGERKTQKCKKRAQNLTKITICNLKDYQNRGRTRGQTGGEQRAQIRTLYKDIYSNEDGNFHKMQEWIWSNLSHVSKLETQLSYKDCENLLEEYDREIIIEVLEAMDNYKALVKNYTSVNKTLRNWIKRRMKDTNGRKDPTDDEIEKTWGKKI
jgi:hypothetical protein